TLLCSRCRMPGLEEGPRRPYRSPLKRSREGWRPFQNRPCEGGEKMGGLPHARRPHKRAGLSASAMRVRSTWFTHAVAGGPSADEALRRLRTIKRTRWGKAVQPTLRPNGNGGTDA